MVDDYLLKQLSRYIMYDRRALLAADITQSTLTWRLGDIFQVNCHFFRLSDFGVWPQKAKVGLG